MTNDRSVGSKQGVASGLSSPRAPVLHLDGSSNFARASVFTTSSPCAVQLLADRLSHATALRRLRGGRSSPSRTQL
eukprot:830065-Pyramimonas_sp.AAC.1